MVGGRFSKYLQCTSLCGVLLLAMCAYSLLAEPAAAGRPVVTSTTAGQPTAASEAMVEFTPETVTFQDVPAGDTYSQTVRITNLGANTLQIKKISTSNADLRITGILLPVVVAHGTSESFTISFRPKGEGRKDGEISIFTSSSGGPMVLTVRASTVKLQSELTASEASIDFKDVAVGGVGKEEVSLTNAGTRDVMIAGISATGAAFSVSGATAVRLMPGQSVAVEVNFAPKSTGRQSGQLTISGRDGGALVLIPLAGTAAESSRSAVKLNWEESPVTVAGYVVYRSADSSGPYTRISDAATSEFVDTGLAAGHTYYYVVTSLNADQVESEYSPPISATVPEA
jgi:hypothetical protein